MTDALATLRAVLDRLDGDLTHRDRLRLHLAGPDDDDWTWPAPLMQDVLGEMDDMYAALTQAVEALEAQPPPADAELLASANRALMGRLEEAERELAAVDAALVTLERRFFGSGAWATVTVTRAEAIREWREAAGAEAAEGDRLQHALSESRAEIARLQAALDGEREHAAHLTPEDPDHA
ncbi:MAG: hypothetical protein ABIL09_05230 [Gemmatimonadota bacterium]